MTFKSHARRSALALSALGLMGALGACSDLLEVEDPGRVTEPTLADTSIISELAASPPGLFNGLYANYAYASAVFTDEAVSGHNFEQWQDVDQRLINDSNSGYGQYLQLHQLRFTSGNFARRIEEMLGDRAASDARVATAYAMEGYALLLLAESHCESPLGPEEAASTPAQIFQAALGPFEKALAIANASNNAAVQNLVRVGLARTYINLNNQAKAVEFASQVPSGFVALARSSDVRSEVYNPFRSATIGQTFNLGVDRKFQNLNDPRIRHQPETPGHNVQYPIAAPFQAPSFSGYSAASTAEFQNGTDIRYASGLEAQYIVAEAQGPTTANLDFINARRAIGNQTPLAAGVSAVDFRRAILDQRARDFYLDGHRIGDLRRFKALYQIDEFPKGENPNPAPRYAAYGTAECFVPTRGERIGNPNY